MEYITASTMLSFLSATASLGSLVYVGPLRKRFPLLAAVVIAFALSILLRGIISLEGEFAALPDSALRFALFSLSCIALPTIVAYAVASVKLAAGKSLVWLYGVMGLALLLATFTGFGEVEARFAGAMPISEALKGYRKLYRIAGIGLLMLAMLSGLNAADLAIRQRCRTTLMALLPLASLVLLHLVLNLFSITPISDFVKLALLPLALSAVLWVLVLEEAELLAPLQIKLQVLLRILVHRGVTDAAALNDCLERAMVLSALRSSENNKAEAARLLGISKSTFHRKASRYLDHSTAESS